MMRLKLIFLSGVCAFCIATLEKTAAQYALPHGLVALPTIKGWKDNNHYLIDKYDKQAKKSKLYSVNVQTGVAVETPAEQAIGRLSVLEINGDLYLANGKGRERLTNTAAVEKLPVLSPDGHLVAFLRDNDLYTKDINTGEEKRYTHDGTETLMNGYASWVYYEEILKRNSKHRAFWWAPNSKYIAFYKFDDSRVPLVRLTNTIGNKEVTENTRYPRAGEPNPTVEVGIADVSTGKVRWANFNKDTEQYIGTPFWMPNGEYLLVQWMPRRQDVLKLYKINAGGGKLMEIYSEKQETWVDWISQVRWVKDGFLMVRDTDGWQQIYFYDNNGKNKRQLTRGNNWNTEILSINEMQGYIIYTSNAELSTRMDAYSVRLTGTGQKRLTFGNYSHDSYLPAPDGKHAITYYSNAATPTRIALINNVGGQVTEIANSKTNAYDAANNKNRVIEWITTDDGYKLSASIAWPKHMEQGRKYPVDIRIYGGPNHPAVWDKWVLPGKDKPGRETIMVVMEHRGSGKNGKRGLNDLYGNLGKYELQDYIQWVKKLKLYTAVDSTKIMISGGSYGGYLTALALTAGSQYFNYGIADYPVTDWQLYDSHYTERYMGLPRENTEGYKHSAVLNYVKNYRPEGKGMLMLRHGTMDDNVHIENTWQLINMLQRANKPFELMVFPGERHGWLGPKVPFTVDNHQAFTDRYLFNNGK